MLGTELHAEPMSNWIFYASFGIGERYSHVRNSSPPTSPGKLLPQSYDGTKLISIRSEKEIAIQTTDV